MSSFSRFSKNLVTIAGNRDQNATERPKPVTCLQHTRTLCHFSTPHGIHEANAPVLILTPYRSQDAGGMRH
ncbi:hypothetical protein WG66_005866 [Moniliophthora roreri]|nr:hypothetical protein WG66_005866 [Moniliophthora roreri]